MDLAIDQAGAGTRWSLAAGIAGFGLQSVTNVALGRQLLAARRTGRIVVDQGTLQAIYGRWWPHTGNLMQVLWDMNFRGVQRDRCELFYHEPLSAPGFLTLSYVHSGPQTSLATFYSATLILDEIAKLKRSHAIVCQVTNDRISDRLLDRWGWQRHCPSWSGRHFIKRFYGEYPEISPHWRERLTLG